MFNVTINVSFRSEPQQVAPQETTFRLKKSQEKYLYYSIESEVSYAFVEKYSPWFSSYTVKVFS
jgi:hypothetical protein